jgi:hypothetical protein
MGVSPVHPFSMGETPMPRNKMHRRDFLKASSAALAAGVFFRPSFAGATRPLAPFEIFDPYFLPLLGGFLTNAKNTAPDYVVCDYPNGTKLKSCCTPSGKTYVSVARMLPAMAEWVRSGRDTNHLLHELRIPVIEEVLLQIYSRAFNPKNPNFWGLAPANRATQLSVEAALVAYALWRLGDDFVAKIPPEQRKNLNTWLASCTQVPERTNNHAWFTCNNQALRLALSKKFPEFTGDEAWMIEDLKALEALYKPNNDGWYSDSPDAGVYDYYNFYAFPNFALYWSRIIGGRYPDWNEKVRSRTKEFFDKVPYFVSASGWQPLYGRSLIYRWTLATGPILGYQENLWPHSPGLLKRIMRKNIEAHWNAGAFDEQNGKLRETLSPGGSTDIRENYIDNGHPYWCMGAFAALGIPQNDRFWKDEEEPLPVEKADYSIDFQGPRMRLIGTHRTGEVKWVQALPAARREYYRDKYMKFVYSSDFPFNTLQKGDQCPPDQMLVFRDPKTGACAARIACDSGELTDDGAQTNWRAKLGDHEFKIATNIRIKGEFELRTHTIESPAAALDIEIREGSYPLGLAEGDSATSKTSHNRTLLRSIRRNALICAMPVNGFDSAEVIDSVGDQKRINVIYPEVRIIVLKGKITAPTMTLTSMHYASSKPLEENEMMEQARELLKRWGGQ